MSNALEEVLAIRDAAAPRADEVTVLSSDPVLPTRFRIGDTCAAVLAGIGIAVNDLWEMKTGRRQTVSIDVRRAAAGLRSSDHVQHGDGNGAFHSSVDQAHLDMRKLTQPWPTKDGRHVLPHFGLPNLRARTLKLLGCDATPKSVADAVARWDALDLEAAIDEARVCGGMVRSNTEWLAEPHGQALAQKPIVEVIKIGDSDPEPMPTGPRPLSGVRVLDLTRILAGPIAARTLAEHGADVLMVTAEHLPQIPEHVLDTSHGKRSCFLNLNDADQADQLRTLVRDADVFSQGYRPGMLERLGFGPQALAEIRPGIIYSSVSCYGADGPFSHRAGWEQVAQTMTGIAFQGRNQDNPDRPALLPGAACDYTTGYLAAYGMLIALARRATEGGSYHVRASLCQSGMFIYRQGLAEFPGFDAGLSQVELDAFRVESHPASGPIRHLGPSLQLSETPGHWVRPAPMLGADRPVWSEANATAAAE